ncbi:probable beta-d-xylosidase 6, partial [Phtheirospermum japonicum]
ITTRTRAQSLICLLSVDEKIQQRSNYASAVPRLGIPPYEWWSEYLQGIGANGAGVSLRRPRQIRHRIPTGHPLRRNLQSKPMVGGGASDRGGGEGDAWFGASQTEVLGDLYCGELKWLRSLLL